MDHHFDRSLESFSRARWVELGRHKIAKILIGLGIIALLAGQGLCALADGDASAAANRPRQKIVDLPDSRGSTYRIAMQPEPIPSRIPSPGNDQSAQPQVLPQPPEQSGPFGPGQRRLPLLDSGDKPVGGTPQPTQQVVDQYQEYVERTIDPENTLDLVKGRPRLLLLKQAPIRVQTADEKIASYTVIDPTQLSIVGNEIGTTILNIWFSSPQPGAPPKILSYLLRVLPDPEQKGRLERIYKALEDEINRTFHDSVVHLALVGDKLVVSGQAKDVVEAAEIIRVVGANAPGGRDQTGSRYVSERTPLSFYPVVTSPDQVPSPDTTEQKLDNYELRNANRNIINLLRVPGEQQVMLRVSVAEVNRTAARSIGLDFAIANKDGMAVFSQVTNAVVSGATLTSTANLPALLDNGQIALAIRALRSLNLARSMAEPNLVTLNGQPAHFRAGGEFPVPAATQSFGGVGQSVAFVPFGVQLKFIPIITDRNRIRLQVAASVSTLDPTLGTNIGGAAAAGGTSVPGLQTRTFENTVELREGQTLAVAGLIQNNFGATSNRVPFFGDLPLVGVLAGRNNTTAGEQELVILVTPELVHPLDACQTPQLPGADVFEPGDCEFFLLNRLESRRSEDFRSSVRTDWHRITRYEHCEDVFIIGAKGHSFNCCGSDGCPRD